MKRTATTLVLLAGFGGGCVSPDAKKDPTGGFGTVSRGYQVPGVQGPAGEPVMVTRGVMPAGGAVHDNSAVQQASLLSSSGSDCNTCRVPGILGSGKVKAVKAVKDSGPGDGGGFGYPQGNPWPGGILPVPGMGPPGAVAAVGAMGIGRGAAIANGRESVRFTGPAGMNITWQLPTGGFNDPATGLTAPKEYNFLQGQTYRLRLTSVLPNHPGKSFYPTLEIASANPKTVTFLAHSSVPLTFTNEDFDQAAAGNLVVKVIYLPDRENQDFATVAGAEELVSTRLPPGEDPVAEAQRRGSILLIVRLGNIDLENRVSPPMTAPPPGMMPPGGPMGGPFPNGGPMGPGMMPGGPMGPGMGAVPMPMMPDSYGAPGRATVSGSPTSRPTGPITPGPIAPGPVPPISSGPPTTLPQIK
jgi:hypothetical protein